MREFTNPANVPSMIYSWVAPAGVTHVLVELWGGGAGGWISSGAGAGYSRGVVPVTPGGTYLVFVGGGGSGNANLENVTSGQMSSLEFGGTRLISAPGGSGGTIDATAAISHFGTVDNNSFAGNAAFGASFCPGPQGDQTGKGGGAFLNGNAGYVLLTW